jgi:uncharacterized protein (DUF305 family)
MVLRQDANGGSRRHRRSTWGGRTVTALSALLVWSAAIACGHHDAHQDGPSNRDPAVTSRVIPGDQVADHNARDIVFAYAMLMQDRQADVLATTAQTNSDDQAVRSTAERILADGRSEKQAFTAWLTQWGEDPNTDKSLPHDKPGQADVSVVSQLQQLTGASFDQLWLATMIPHHQGAIEIAKREIAGGTDVDAVTMAKSILASRQAELTDMQALQTQSPSSTP